MDDIVEALRQRFSEREDVAFALLFGSRASGTTHAESDWDLAVYFTDGKPGLDLEDERRFAGEDALWGELESIVGASVDMVVLNRAPATIAAAALYGGLSLSCRDERLFSRYSLAAMLLAEDERDFAQDYARIKARSASLSPVDRDRLVRYMDFIRSELSDFEEFAGISRDGYSRDSGLRRNVERWIENLVNASIDIAKTILASEGRPIPQTYREILMRLGDLPGFDPADCRALADFSRLRNLLAHEYLDLRYPSIERFVQEVPPLLRRLTEQAERFMAR